MCSSRSQTQSVTHSQYDNGPKYLAVFGTSPPLSYYHIMPFSYVGASRANHNYRSGVALAMCHRLCGIYLPVQRPSIRERQAAQCPPGLGPNLGVAECKFSIITSISKIRQYNNNNNNNNNNNGTVKRPNSLQGC